MAEQIQRTHARPLTPDDEAVLAPIDAFYAEKTGLASVLTPGSVSFYARSGHSFVAVSAGEETGFILAHAVWDGTRPTVQVSRLAVANLGDDASREALLEALTKSAYDAAVYDLQVQHPQADEAGVKALQIKDYKAANITLFERVLGSRGQKGVTMARVLLGVKGMKSREAADKVQATLLALDGVERVSAGIDQQASVEYDDGEATTMDLIRALRNIGFQAGME